MMTEAASGQTQEGRPSETDVARAAAARRVAEQAHSGALTLDEYAERAAAIEQAGTVEELDAAVLGLPEEGGSAAPGRRGRWLIGVFGGTEQRGRWRLSNRLRVIALLGGVRLDLGPAEPEATESLITIVAVLGGVELTAPPGVPIQLSGFSLLGGKSDERAGGPPLPASPLIRARVFAVLGGVKVKDRLPRRNLLEVIRARSAGRTAHS